jgi:hypothetical protein
MFDKFVALYIWSIETFDMFQGRRLVPWRVPMWRTWQWRWHTNEKGLLKIPVSRTTVLLVHVFLLSMFDRSV